MASTRVMEVRGLDALRSAMERVPERVQSYAADAVEKSTFAVAQRVRQLAPRDTGTLQRAIGSSSRGLNGRVTIGPEAYYWRFVEYGSVRGRSGQATFSTAARPFVRTAAEEETEPFVQRMTEVARRLERDFSASRFL